MDNETSNTLLKEVRQQVLGLQYDNRTLLDALRKKIQLYIEKIFGPSSEYKETLKKISFSPSIAWSGMSNHHYFESWESGKSKTVNLIDTMLEDIELTTKMTPAISETKDVKEPVGNKVFIVHGHNEEMKESSARTLEKIGLSPIILHEQANQGRTIIEKFTEHSDVGFAVVLLSADDVAYSIAKKPEDGKLRARQNVILELGFFLGKLGRQRVVILFQETQNFEFPSDYNGVLYIPFDKTGNWKFSLLRELRTCGYQVDANSLL